MMRLAFYIGRGGWPDRVIRWATRSPYSHVELVDDEGRCWSASHRDKGVRVKRINVDSGNWTLVDVPWLTDADLAKVAPHLGAGYDYPGIVMSQMVGLSRHHETRWFCSELVAMVMGYPNPHRYSPAMLYEIVTTENARLAKHLSAG